MVLWLQHFLIHTTILRRTWVVGRELSTFIAEMQTPHHLISKCTESSGREWVTRMSRPKNNRQDISPLWNKRLTLRIDSKYSNIPSVRRFRKVDEAKAKSLREPGRLFIAHGNKCAPAVWSSAIIIVISAADRRATKIDKYGKHKYLKTQMSLTRSRIERKVPTWTSVKASLAGRWRRDADDH